MELIIDGEHLVDSFHQGIRPAVVSRRHERRKLIAADPGGGLGAVDRLTEDFAGPPEHRVARGCSRCRLGYAAAAGLDANV